MTYSIRYIRDDIVKTLNISVYKIFADLID